MAPPEGAYESYHFIFFLSPDSVAAPFHMVGHLRILFVKGLADSVDQEGHFRNRIDLRGELTRRGFDAATHPPTHPLPPAASLLARAFFVDRIRNDTASRRPAFAPRSPKFRGCTWDNSLGDKDIEYPVQRLSLG